MRRATICELAPHMQLLKRPGGRRVRGYIAVNEAVTAMLDYDEHMELTASGGDENTGIVGNDPLGVLCHRGQPVEVREDRARRIAAARMNSKTINQ